MGVNGVEMDRHRLILSQDGATSSRKVFRYLPGLCDIIKNQRMLPKSKHVVNYSILLLNPSLLSAYAGPLVGVSGIGGEPFSIKH